jgi:MFS family permease
MKRRPAEGSALPAIFVASALAQTGIQLVVPALPAVQEAFSMTASSIAWVTSAFLIPSVLLGFPLGVVADRVGRGKVVAISLIVMGISGGLMAMVSSVGGLVALRALQGAAFAPIPALTISMIGDYRSGAAMLRTQGHRFIVLALSGGLLPVIGGVLAGASWRLVFLAQLVAVPVGIWCWLALRTDRTEGSRSEFWHDLRRTFADGGAVSLHVAGFLRFFFKFGLLTYLPILLADRGHPLPFIGLVLGVGSVAGMASAGLLGRATERIKPSTVMVWSLLAIAVGFFGVATLENRWLILGMVAIGSIGDSGYGVLQNALAVSCIPAHIRGSFLSVSGAVRNLGKLSAPILIAALLALWDLEFIFVLLGVLALAASVTVAPVRRMDGLLREVAPVDGSLG